MKSGPQALEVSQYQIMWCLESMSGKGLARGVGREGVSSLVRDEYQLFSMYTFVSKKVTSVSDIPAMNFIVECKLFASSTNLSISYHLDLCFTKKTHHQN